MQLLHRLLLDHKRMLHILLLAEGILTICECRGPQNDPGGDGKLVMLTGVLHTRHHMLALPEGDGFLKAT